MRRRIFPALIALVAILALGGAPSTVRSASLDPGTLVVTDSARRLISYGGTVACASGDFIRSLSVAGVATCATAPASPVLSVFGRIGNVVLLSADISAALGFTPYSAANPASYITAAGAPVQSVAGRTGAVTLSNTDISGLGTAATHAAGDFATAAQGALADTAVQPGALATVATTGAYVDLSGKPTLGTAAAQNIGVFASAAQGALADTAVQPVALNAYVPTTRTINGLALSTNLTLTKSDIGLGNVENTALSTWAGSSNLVTFGTTRNTMALATGTDAATTMTANTLYTVDLSAWATADRNYTLPAAPSVGDRVGIIVQAGNASFELIIKGNTSQTINGGSAASEWSRLFITGESVVLRYVATNKWIVDYDGRIAMKAQLRLSANAAGESASTLTLPTDKSGVWTADVDVGSITTVSNGKITARRAGYFDLSMGGISASAVADQNFFGISVLKNGSAAGGALTFQSTTGQTGRAQIAYNSAPLAVDDFVQFVFRTQEGSRGLLAAAITGFPVSFITMHEVLP